MEHDQVELPPGRVLPDDIRCMKCNSWLRGGPQAWGRALDQESEEASSPKTLWLSVAALAAGVASMIAHAALAPDRESESSAPVVAGTLVFAVVAAVLAWLAIRPMLREHGGLLAGVGAAVAFVLSPLLYLIFAFVL